MATYIARRLLLLPITLFCIVLVNFIILNLAPGDPISVTEVSPEGGATRREDASQAFGTDDRYLQFREFYGLTLPILFNWWPWTSPDTIKNMAWTVTNQKGPDGEELTFQELQDTKVALGDKARFVMPALIQLMNDKSLSLPLRKTAARFFIRGGTGFAELGPTLNNEQKAYNKFIGKQNQYLREQMPAADDNEQKLQQKVDNLIQWYSVNKERYGFETQGWASVALFFKETRFWKYMSRVLTLDFGTLRNDSNKTVISEVTKRFKYSLTLSIVPMFITFFLCIFFGFTMALYHGRPLDYGFNLIFLVLYAIPIFVVAPFLIEKVALNNHFPWTNTPIPIGGFTSPTEVYDNLTSWQRLLDVFQHIALPLVAILYGGLAAQARLSRTAVLEVLRQDYVRTAKAKGVARSNLLTRHVGRNAAITIVTSIAGSLGVVLGGSLIVETLFQIDGFGKFFYDAIVNRDYNVVMFSALAGAILSLLGYLAADLSYAFLDPRVTLD